MTLASKINFIVVVTIIFICPYLSFSQVHWINADSAFGPLPASVHVYKSTDSLNGKPFIAYYASALLKDRLLDFTTDTSRDRRFTPLQFYKKDDQPLLVVNCTFFSYETNRSVNLVINNGKMVAFNNHCIPMRGKDTFQYRHPIGSAIGINKKREADIAWLITDSLKRFAYASQLPVTKVMMDSLKSTSFEYLKANCKRFTDSQLVTLHFKKWKMRTAVGGGPVLLQNGEIKVTNEEELKFTGKAINDKHPRTAMGYTPDGRLIIMVIAGRYPGIAEGATLTQEAQLLKDLGCIEALNLDGGGSSCMLINGKETIKPSEKGEERPVPAVFLIKAEKK
jgi:hypothetical protein